MNLEDAIKKCSSDLDDIMQSIEAVKGQRFVEILAIHINFTTLVRLVNSLKGEDIDEKLFEAIQYTAITVATTSLALLTSASKMGEAEVNELISWGDRLEKMVKDNFNQAKGSE